MFNIIVILSMLSTLRRSTRTRRSPSRYGFGNNSKIKCDGLDSIIEAIEILENSGFSIEDPIDKYVDHYDNIEIPVEKTGTHCLKFVYDNEESDYISDSEFKLALLNAQGDHKKWIKIVEKGVQQWKKNYIDLTE